MTKTNIPPYISTPKLETVLNLLSTRNFSTLQMVDLINRGFSKSDASQTLLALRFLHLVDQVGKVKEDARKLQLKGPERDSGLSQLIKSSYNQLFEIAPEANKMSRDELHNEFISIYGISRRLASSAIPAFLYLCKVAGLETNEEIKPKARPNRKSAQIEKSLTYQVKTQHKEEATSSEQNIEGVFAVKDYEGLKVTISSNYWFEKLTDGKLKTALDEFEALKPEHNDKERSISEVVGEAE